MRHLSALTWAAVSLFAMAILSAPVAQAADDSATIVLKSVLVPSSKISNEIAGTQYGSVLYTGVASWAGDSVQIERLVTFRYTRGSGPASGFLTLTWPDGSRLALEGSGFVNASPNLSEIFVAFNVFGSTGRWKGYVGIGRQDCTRRGGVEAKGACTYVVKVHKGR